MPPAWPAAEVWAASALLALVCGLVESAPLRLDDNVTVPAAGAMMIMLLAPMGTWSSPSTLGRSAAVVLLPALGAHVAVGFGVNLAIALVALAAESIDRAGAASAVVIGTAITVGLGMPGLAVMIAFFVVGTAATRLGYRVKAARGHRAGARRRSGLAQRLGQWGRAGGAGRAGPDGRSRPARGPSTCWPTRRRWRRPPPTPAPRDREGLRPPHVPHHHVPAGATCWIPKDSRATRAAMMLELSPLDTAAKASARAMPASVSTAWSKP